MAINRQDYQYIRNTIPGQQNKKSDSSLGIGEKISNIVVDLNQTNVHNSFYEEYYSEKLENEVWDCIYTTGTQYESTIKDGMLKTTTILEPNTSYVLQVIDAVQTSSAITEQNSIQWQGHQSVEFNNYLFFNTGDLGENKNTTLKINGISFGYKIYAPINGDVCELRSIVSPVEAKVFLFKSDLPWFVDKQGVIVGLHDTPLKMMASTSSTARSPYLTESELINIFSKKPNLAISSTNDKQTLRVLLPDALESSNTWKHYSLWNKTKTNGKTPLIEKMRLIVYRDFLTPTLRDYNNQRIKQSKGIIRGIQCTNKTENDPYTKLSEEIDSIKILFNQPKLNIDSSTTSINFDFIPDGEESFKEYVKTAEEKMNAVEEMSLAVLSLLGYNFQYSVDNDLFTQEDENLPYRYTSICFAWGYQEGNALKRISDFSEPVLLDRDAVSMTYSDNEYTLTLKDCSLSKGILIPYYYTNEIIYLTK